jgi:hypothetical protein
MVSSLIVHVFTVRVRDMADMQVLVKYAYVEDNCPFRDHALQKNEN